MKDKIVSIPWMGRRYTLILKEFLESLGINVMLPPVITEQTIKLGVRHSSDMMCFPYKVTLGNFIEALEKGANILLMYDNCGQCRQRHYWKIHEFTLRNLGYNFEIYPVSRQTLIPLMKKLSGKSALTIFKAYKSFVKKIKAFDEKKYQWSKDKLNIGIIGEIYTCCEEKINHDIESKLRKLDSNPFNTSALSEFIQSDTNVKFFKNIFGVFKSSNIKKSDDGIFYSENSSDLDKSVYKKKAEQYLNGPVGGHGFENIYNLLWMKDLGVDGIIHLLPLSCMPETTVEPVISQICQDANIPLLRLPIDETNSEANVDTRVETFVELIKRKRGTT